MSTKPTITAIVPYFGSKRRLAPVIVEALGKHSAYWEPFCGSMAVLLAKPPSGHETVNDLNGDLINLARIIQDRQRGAVLYRRLRRVLCDENIRDELLVAPPTDDPIERAFRYFVISWLGRNGFCGTKGCDASSFAVRWTPSGGHGGQRFNSAVASIPAWRERMRRPLILQRDGFDVIENIADVPGVAIYCDPPYFQKDAEYIHDFRDGGMFGDDHARLAAALARFKKARVVVSYYAHPRLAELYPQESWEIRDCTISKGLHNAGRRGSEIKYAPEVLICNQGGVAKCCMT